jgi:WXG100 family type VII secretion target
MTQITLDAEQVRAIATEIDSDNQELRRLLEESKSDLNSLSSYWSGQASEDTIEAYNGFANQYFQKYEDILNQYVKFLRANVAEDYSEAESKNISLADAFK